MLVSRGAITPAELPPAFAGMTAVAAGLPPSRRPPDFAPDFLGLGRPIEPRVPVRGVVRLDLENLRVWFDPAAGVPRLIVSQSVREQPGGFGGSAALYRWPGLSGQPDEVALARAGIGLTRLVDRREVVWGPREVEAARGANLIATMVPLGPVNVRNPRFGAWAQLQSWMRVNHNPTATRAMFFTGAVPGPGPNGAPVTRSLWKVAVSTDVDGRLSVDAAILPGSNPGGGELPGRTTVETIERLSGIDFSALRRAIAASALPAPARPVGAPTATLAPRPVVNRVYVEAKGLSTAAEQAIANALRAEGFVVPRIEQVDPCIAVPEVRYYFRQDAEGAALASSVAASVIRAAGRGDVTVTIKRLDAKRYKAARPGTIELWVCDPAALRAAT
jgi:hypothetical protein